MTIAGRHTKPGPIAEGEVAYEHWRDGLLADPEFRAVYEEEATKSEL